MGCEIETEIWQWNHSIHCTWSIHGAIAEYPGPATTCFGVLWKTRYITIDAILIQWDANKWQGIQFSQVDYLKFLWTVPQPRWHGDLETSYGMLQSRASDLDNMLTSGSTILFWTVPHRSRLITTPLNYALLQSHFFCEQGTGWRLYDVWDCTKYCTVWIQNTGR